MDIDERVIEDAWGGDVAAIADLWKTAQRHDHIRLRYYTLCCWFKRCVPILARERGVRSDRIYLHDWTPRDTCFACGEFYFDEDLCAWVNAIVQTPLEVAVRRGDVAWDKIRPPYKASVQFLQDQLAQRDSYIGDELPYLLHLGVLVLGMDGSLLPGPAYPTPNWSWIP